MNVDMPPPRTPEKYGGTIGLKNGVAAACRQLAVCVCLHPWLAISLGCAVVTASWRRPSPPPVQKQMVVLAGDWQHNGAPIHVPVGTTLAFAGTARGAGGFTGAGTVRYDGAFHPGNSPALITYGGDVVLGTFLTLNMELGGLTRGTQYDAMNVAGKLTFGGTLNVTLINAWQPDLGNVYNLFDWGTTAGTFATVNLPALAAGRFWRTELLYVDGTLRVSPVPGTYAQWQAAFGTGAFGADDDQDGIPNGIEFLLGTNPNATTTPATPLTELIPSTGGTVTARVTFTIPELPATDAHYRLRASNDLVTWTLVASKDGLGPWTGSASVTTDPPAAGYTGVTVTETLPGTTTKRFHKLEAQ